MKILSTICRLFIIHSGLFVLALTPNSLSAQEVSQTGSYNYKYPLQIPPGTNNLHPHLFLKYNSASKNGMVGTGWSLGGISTITRDKSYPITFTDDDHFLHSGAKLIREIEFECGNYEYHRKRERFERIEAHFLYTPTSYWTVTPKNGPTMVYGYDWIDDDTSQDGFIEATVQLGGGYGYTPARVWALRRVIDVFGNYYLIDYAVDEEHGDYYPKKISYTLNRQKPILKIRTIEFLYEKRPDVYIRYVPSGVIMDMRLKWIVVKADDKLVRKYRLDYDTGINTGLSRLISITEYGSDGNTPEYSFDSIIVDPNYYPTGSTLPPTTFTYSDAVDDQTLLYAFNTNFNTEHSSDLHFPMDVNGDGRTDFTKVWDDGGQMSAHVKISKGSEFYSQQWANKQGPFTAAQEWFTGDFDGDGKDDLMKLWNDKGKMNADVHRSNGSQFVIESWAIEQGGYWDEQTWIAGDFNGDGRTDIMKVWDEEHKVSADVHVSNGISFQFQHWVTEESLYHTASYETMQWKTGDLNGDKLTDLIQIVKVNETNGGIEFWLSSGNSFNHSHAGIIGPWVEDNVIHIADINGDGCDDVMRTSDVAGITHIETWISKGPFNKLRDEAIVHTLESWANTTYKVQDVNGDGRSDIIEIKKAISKTLSRVWLSNGSGFTPQEVYGDFGTRGSQDEEYAMDVDGDGRKELLKVTPETGTTSVKIYMPNGDVPDLLSTIGYSTGGNTQITYIPAPQLKGAIDPSESRYPLVADKSPRNLVINVKDDDGLGLVSSTDYEHKNGKKLMGMPDKRVDLGFSWIREYHPDPVTGGYTDTFYCHENPSYYTRGLISKRLVCDAQENIFKEYDYFFSERTPNQDFPEVKNILLTHEWFWDYDGTDDADWYAKHYHYDEYGNIDIIQDEGVKRSRYDDIETTIEYRYMFEYYDDFKGYSKNMILPVMKKVYRYGVNNDRALSKKEYYHYDCRPWFMGPELWGVLTQVDQCTSTETITVQYGYSGTYGNRVLRRDAKGYEYRTEYDPDYNTFVIKKKYPLDHQVTTLFNNQLKPHIEIDTNGQIWETQYDPFERVTGEIEPLDDFRNPTLNTHYFDDIFPRKTLKEYRESDGNYLQKHLYRDGFGRIIQTKKGKNGTNRWLTIDYYYDECGRNWKTSVPYSTNTSSYTERDSTIPCTKYVYDSIGRILKSYNTDGTFKQYVYDHQKTTVIDESKHVEEQGIDWDTYTRYETVFSGEYPNHIEYATTFIRERWDGTRITDHYGNVIETKEDELGRKTRHTDPDMGEWTYTYDKNNNLIKQTDAKDQTLYYEYDEINRITKKDYPDGTDVAYTYGVDESVFNKGRLTNVTYNGGSKYYEYDQQGRIITETRIVAGKPAALSTTYDAMDRIIQHRYPDGEEVFYSYDEWGNLESVYNNSGYHYVDHISYIPLGKTSFISYGNGVSTTYDYYDNEDETDASSGKTLSYRLKEIETAPDKILHMQFEYDRVDNIVCKRDLNHYYYDEIYSYDEFNRLKSAYSDMYGFKNYEYDEINNIIEKDGNIYSYCETEKPHAVISDGIYIYQYDSNGNQIERSDGRIIEHDFENRVIASSDETSYLYDETGQRIYKRENGTSLLYFFPQYEEEYIDGNPEPNKIKYYFANNQRIAKSSDDLGLLYFHKDHLGSSVRITDYFGDLIHLFKYDPFGAEIVNQSTLNVEDTVVLDSVTISLNEEHKARLLINIAGTIVIIKDTAEVTFVAGETITIGSGFRVEKGATVHFAINPSYNETYTDVKIRYLYTEQEKDNYGFYYYGARYYDPILCRFTTPDTVLDGLNRYAYCQNNPVRYVDPTGHGYIDNYVGRIEAGYTGSAEEHLQDSGWTGVGGSGSDRREIINDESDINENEDYLYPDNEIIEDSTDMNDTEGIGDESNDINYEGITIDFGFNITINAGFPLPLLNPIGPVTNITLSIGKSGISTRLGIGLGGGFGLSTGPFFSKGNSNTGFNRSFSISGGTGTWGGAYSYTISENTRHHNVSGGWGFGIGATYTEGYTLNRPWNN